MKKSNWIDEAEGDLEHAKSDTERGFYNWACFSAQQAAEKGVISKMIEGGIEIII